MSALNPQQESAVTHLGSPLLVLAGAGSGKTRVITEKVAWLVENNRYASGEIAAITFTNKAAREMRRRLGKRLGRRAAKGLAISTFHALGWKLISAEPEACGRKKGMSILDAGASQDLIADLLPAMAGKEQLFIFVRRISRFKDAGWDPATALARAEDDDDARAAEIYRQYTDRLVQLNAVDFDDLIALPARYLEDPEARTRWRRKFRYLLVDEYQDTSLAQYRLLKALAGEAGNFTAVGDDDQSIYGWRGARPENLSRLAEDFPGLRVIKLEQNYRSAGKILKAANAVIACNPHDFEKKLWSELGPGDNIRITRMADDREEAEAIARDLLGEHFGGRCRWADNAVLYRSNHLSRTLEQALRENNIPYVVTGGPSWFDAREIRDCLAYLRLMVNPEDNPALLRVANTPRRGLGGATLGKVGEFAARQGMSLFAAAGSMGVQQAVSERGGRALRGFSNLLVDFNDRAERGDPAEAFRDLLDHIHYREWLESQCDEPRQADRRLRNLEDLVGWVDRLAEDTDSLEELLARVTLAAGPEDESDDPGDQVRLMTLHAAKGLEFKRVYLVGCEDGILPHRNSLEEGRLEEERRLMYVGITRAERQLFISYCQRRRRYGEWIECEPSRFLEEIPADILDWPEGGAASDTPPVAARDRIADLKALLG